MAIITQKDQVQLDRIKKSIEKSHDYEEDNARRWHDFQKFIFLTSIRDEDRAILEDLKKPQIEFNVLEAFISRLCGEFSKQQPSIEAYTIGQDQVAPPTVEMVEGYFRNMEYEARHNGTANRLYKDQLSGGYSVAKVWTEYASDESFDQIIKWGRVFDPTLCGFDPMAITAHKGDGRYVFECFPRPREEIEEMYKIDLDGLKYTKKTPTQKKDAFGNTRNIAGFNWSYKNNREDIVMLCDYFEKQNERTKIHKLTSGDVVTDKKYQIILDKWKVSGKIEQHPQITSSRWSNVQTIVRYRLIEDRILETKETNFSFLPRVFFDGNSVLLRATEEGEVNQYTRPYIYQAVGIQLLKNFAGQTLANELENLVQHKFKVPVEAIPAEYQDVYSDTQVPNVLLYNQFKDNDPNIRLDPPQEIQRPPIPGEIAAAFAGADQAIQAILGSYDASLGINNNQLSGIAIVEGATQSNAAAMPYVINYLEGLSQIARIVVDLIPKYLVTPITVPIIGKDGKRKFMPLNQPGQPKMNFNSSTLNIKVEAGVNFEIQKDKNMRMLQQIMQMSPLFAQFIGTKGLPILIDNIDIKGSGHLKELAEEFMQEREKQPPTPNPALMNAQTNRMKVQQDGQQNEEANKIKGIDLAMKQDTIDNGHVQAMAAAHDDSVGRDIEQERIDAEKSREVTDIALKAMDLGHQHAKDKVEMAHKVVKE